MININSVLDLSTVDFINVINYGTLVTKSSEMRG